MGSRFLADAEAVVGPLRGTLRELVASVSSGRRRGGIPGLHTTLSSRLRRGLETDSVPLSMAHLPGPDGLRRALVAAKAAGASTEMVKRCRVLINEYAAFLHRENLTLDRLQAILSGFLPNGREDVVQRNSQAALTAMRNITGCSAEGMVQTTILWPGDEFSYHYAFLRGYLGWERLRADAWPLPASISITKQPGATTIEPAQTLDGEPLEIAGGHAILQRFCNGPVPDFHVVESKTATSVAYVHGPEIGVRSACDVFFGHRIPNAIERWPSEEFPSAYRMFNHSVQHPIRRLLLDVLVHDEVWPGFVPVAETYRIVPNGRVVGTNVEQRQDDRVELGTTSGALRRGLADVENTTMGRYRALLEHAFGRLDLPIEQFRGYRLEVLCPLYSFQYSMRFDLRSRAPG